jgi:hypothetical protein
LQVQAQLNYLVAIDRAGNLKFFEYQKGRRKLLIQAHFDLMDLLFANAKVKPTPQKVPLHSPTLPAFIQMEQAPLRFPAVSIRLRPFNNWKLGTSRIAVMTESRRLLFWDSYQQGALELFPHISEGDVYLTGDHRSVDVTVHNLATKRAIFYHFDLIDPQSRQFDWLEEIGTLYRITYDDDHLYGTVYKAGGIRYSQIHRSTGQIIELTTEEFSKRKTTEVPSQNKKSNASDLKKLVNIGYTTLIRANSLAISHDGTLYYEGRYLIMNEKGELVWELRKPPRSDLRAVIGVQQQDCPVLPGTATKIHLGNWENRVTAFIDPRGFLHLKSQAGDLAEVTIVTVIGAPTTAWTSAGFVTGNSYFMNGNASHVVATDQFLQQYLMPMIARILKK